jgi:hypothetical protein
VTRRRPWARPAKLGAAARPRRSPSRRALAAAAREIQGALRITVPALAPRRRVAAAVALAGAVIVILGCAAWASGGRLARWARHPRLAVSLVEVVGAHHAGAAAIERVAGIRAGDPWLLVDASAARRRVRTHPWVEDATIERPWIGRVKIVVRECVPVALVSWGGRPHGLASDLTILPPAPVDTSRVRAALPVIAGVAARGKRGIDLGSLERGAVPRAAADGSLRPRRDRGRRQGARGGARGAGRARARRAESGLVPGNAGLTRGVSGYSARVLRSDRGMERFGKRMEHG